MFSKRSLGLGYTPPTMDEIIGGSGGYATGTSTTPTKSNWIDTASDIFKNILKPGAEIFQSVRSGSGGSNLPGGGPPVNSGLSTGAKVGIAVGGATLVGTVLYLAFRPKKALGDLGKRHSSRKKK